jgi:hypothetical protein
MKEPTQDRRHFDGDIESIDRYRVVAQMDQSLARWAWYIWDELETIKQIPEKERAYHAMVFAMISPRCHFDKNAAVTPDIVRALQFGAPVGSIERILRHYGIGLAYQKSHRLFDAKHAMERFNPDRAMLLNLRGVGPKVSAMALALYDDALPVVTLDTHMLSGITGQDVNTISPARYRHLEKFTLECMNDARRNVAPYATPFAIQWSLWCDYSGKGFVSHLPIFGLSPE